MEVDAEGVVTVDDDGRGIPVGTHKETGVSALELVFTRLHAGGKFGSGGYKVSGGLHGVGASVTNALSEWLEVEVRRDGHVWRQRYERGVRIGDVEKVRKLVARRGHGHHGALALRRRHLRPRHPLLPGHDRGAAEGEVVPRPRPHLPPAHARPRGAGVPLRPRPRRLRASDLNEARDPAHGSVISLRSDDGEVPAEIALQWTQTAEERVYGFCNVVNTVDGGTHVSGLRAARSHAPSTPPRTRAAA